MLEFRSGSRTALSGCSGGCVVQFLIVSLLGADRAAVCAAFSVAHRRTLVGTAAQEFLLEIKGTRQVDLGAVALVAVRQARGTDEDTRLTALRWLRELVQLARQALLPQCAAILGAVLPAISSPTPALARVRPAPYILG